MKLIDMSAQYEQLAMVDTSSAAFKAGGRPKNLMGTGETSPVSNRSIFCDWNLLSLRDNHQGCFWIQVLGPGIAAGGGINP